MKASCQKLSKTITHAFVEWIDKNVVEKSKNPVWTSERFGNEGISAFPTMNQVSVSHIHLSLYYRLEQWTKQIDFHPLSEEIQRNMRVSP